MKKQKFKWTKEFGNEIAKILRAKRKSLDINEPFQMIDALLLQHYFADKEFITISISIRGMKSNKIYIFPLEYLMPDFLDKYYIPK